MADRSIAPPRRDESQIAEEAARWLEALKTAGPQQQAEFAAWLRRSSRHVHFFLHTTALDGLLEHADPDREFDIAELVREAPLNVVTLGGTAPAEVERQNAGRAGLMRRRLAACIGALAIAAVLLIAMHPWGWKEFTTHVGEQRAVELQDGSIVHLNTASRVRVRLTDKARELQLIAGEALFAVRRDAHRPFKVHVDDSVIQALGTEFNVHRRAHDTKVSVLEGAVRISVESEERRSSIPSIATSLLAGEEAHIESNGRVHSQRVPDIVNAAAWRERRLVFRADSLSDVVAEFNRYNRSTRIRLEGLDGSSRHYTGSFDARDPDAFAAVLAEEKALSVEHNGDEIVIRPR